MSTRTTGRTRTDRRRRLSRYDLLLALLPLPLLLGTAGAALTAIPLSIGVGYGSLPTLLLLAYGLFVDGPTPVADDS